jgi:AcrR family transcriptional regulator
MHRSTRKWIRKVKERADLCLTLDISYFIYFSPSVDANMFWDRPDGIEGGFMATPLEKARRDPNSMKARILDTARKLFAENGYSGTTTRMIAKEVGIDISTLYYHWGEKADLYDAVLTATREEIKLELKNIEKVIHGKPLRKRLEIAINMSCDYLFQNPEITNLILLNYFTNSQNITPPDFNFIDIISGIAISMGLAMDKDKITKQTKARVMAVMLSLFNFIAGKKFLIPIIDAESEEYLHVVKETLNFILIPAFIQGKNEVF